MTIIQTNALAKRFGSFQALKDVQLDVKEGEIYGFIGPNGAGKSTTIRILLGMLKATSGSASIFGLDAWKDAVAIHSRLAYVPGDVNLWPNLTGGEVIDLFMKLRGEINKKRRDELIEQFNLDPSKKCRTYSKGNRQKVALVAAFASEPELFILDEPTSGLDPLMERVFQENVLRAKNEGRSVLLSSHILSEVERLCDRVGIIRQGTMIESGTMSELRHLTRTQMTVETKQPLELLQTMDGLFNVELPTATSASFQVDTDKLAPVMAQLGQLGIVKIDSAPPTLEDLFMRHYEEGDAK